MSSWLRKEHKNTDEAPAIRPDVERLLPASVRPPEAHRPMLLDSDVPDDERDEDLDFLATLVEEIDGTPQAVKAAPATAFGPAVSARRAAEHQVDELRVFRDMKDDGRTLARHDFLVDNVEMDDLLEELSIVRAALRRRKAA